MSNIIKLLRYRVILMGLQESILHRKVILWMSRKQRDLISILHIKRKRNSRNSYFSEVVREYSLRMHRTGGKNCNEVNEKGLV